MLALLIYCYANGLFSSRRIERATYRDIGIRFVAANLHPDHDTIAVFRRSNKAAFEAAFLQVLLLARESGLLHLGTVSIDGTKIDASASIIRSVRYDRAQELRAKLASDIADLTAKAEAADADGADPQALPAELARREALRASWMPPARGWKPRPRRHVRPMKPNRQPMRARRATADGRRCRLIRPRPAERQSNLTDPDSSLMRRSERHEYRQAYNAQAVVCADGAQLVLATNLVATTADAPSFAATILAMERTIGLPKIVLADTGYASGPAVAALGAKKIEPLVAIGRTQPHRPYDFRPPPQARGTACDHRTLADHDEGPSWRPKMAASGTGNENRASNRYSGSSKARSALSASTCAVSQMPQASGP